MHAVQYDGYGGGPSSLKVLYLSLLDCSFSFINAILLVGSLVCDSEY